MKKIILLIAFLLISKLNFAQEIIGKWNGSLDIQGAKLPLSFNISKTDAGFSSTMDSPTQGAMGIPVTTTKFENNKLTILIPAGNIEYIAELLNDKIVGNFKQNGMSLPLEMSKKEVKIEVKKLNRPQEPKEPFSYYSEDVKFENKDKNLLAGTLTLPKKEGVFPVVILISGSGPQDRNSTILGHKSFFVIADYFIKNGIGVLRYDDRGVAESKGDFKSANSNDFADDVDSALAYLMNRKEVNKSKIGLIGHSEGGLIAPIVAARNKNVSFIAMLAGPGVNGGEILLLQQELILRANGETEENIKINRDKNKIAFEVVQKSKNSQDASAKIEISLKEEIKANPKAIPNGVSEKEFINTELYKITYPWMYNFLKYDPKTNLEKVKCPVFALNGSKDLQVPPKENLGAIKKALTKAGNKNFITKEYPNLNHLFQESKTGSPSEYETIEQTISPVVLEDLSNWILKIIK